MSFEQPTCCGELLNFRIARLLSFSGALQIRLCEGRFGISRREWRLIAMLADFGPLAPSELAEHARTDRPQVSRAVHGLEAKGLVARQATEQGTGRSRVRVQLTDKGWALHRELFPLTAEINSRILGALSPDQIRALDAALDTLTVAAQQVCQTYPLTEKADRRSGGGRPEADRPDLLDAW